MLWCQRKPVRCFQIMNYSKPINIVLQATNLSHYQLSYRSLLTLRKISKDYGQILMDNKITVSILTHRCQCPHDRLKRGGDRGGATHIYKRKLSSEPHVKKRYKLGNHLFHTPAQNMGSPWDVATVPKRHLRDVIGSGVCYLG